MFHNRKPGKPMDQHITMPRAVATYLLENSQIETIVSHTKEAAPMVRKVITLAKNANPANYRRALSYLTKENAVRKLFNEIGPRYAIHNDGYTHVVRIRPHRGDCTGMAIVQLV